MAETLNNENARKKCQSAKKLTDEEINERMKKVGDGWTLSEGKLTNTFYVGDKKRDSFTKAFSFAQTVARLAEQHCHHPEITIKWGSCEVSFWTHSVDGLSAFDFEMADRVNRELCNYLDKPLHLYPTSFNEARTSATERRYSLPLPPVIERGTYWSSPDPRKKLAKGAYMEPPYRPQPH